jgi:hypothetical protein
MINKMLIKETKVVEEKLNKLIIILKIKTLGASPNLHISSQFKTF